MTMEMVNGVWPENPADTNVNQMIGAPVERVEGPLKVSGRAAYAADHAQAGVAHGFVVRSTVGHGRIIAIDSAAALASPGVLTVLTHENAPGQAAAEDGKTAPQLNSDKIDWHGQPVALVLAESFEQARAAAQLVRVDVEEQPGAFAAEAAVAGAKPSPSHYFVTKLDKGAFDDSFRAAAVQLDLEYHTPSQSHAAIEPHATTAEWQGDRLEVDAGLQMLAAAKGLLARTFNVDKKSVRILSRYVGGGFGGKLGVTTDAVLAALGARALGRPVRLVLNRQAVFTATHRRPETLQRVRIGADADGRVRAIAHESWCSYQGDQQFWEPSALATRTLYGCDTLHTMHYRYPLNAPPVGAMRAPGEAVGMLATENAVDELADHLGIDPVALRLMNEPELSPDSGKPFSARKLTECLEEGARRFSWDRRNPVPGQQRDGDWLVGLGMASSFRKDLLNEARATVSLGADGIAIVRTDLTDIGTGSYSILSQIAAELLGLPLSRVRTELGDSDLPVSPGSGGSWGASSTGSAVLDACMQLRATLAKAMDAGPDEALFREGRVIAGNRALPIEALVGDGISAEGLLKVDAKVRDQWSHAGYGAHFAEVGVHVVTGEVRVRRMLGVFAAGRILNERTARSQLMGGMIWGIGAALHEGLEFDHRTGFLVTHDLAHYHIASHADVPAVEVVLLDEVDDKANPLKAKGVGELGIGGAGAAVTNAIYNACGVRVRSYPVTPDKLLAGLPELE